MPLKWYYLVNQRELTITQDDHNSDLEINSFVCSEKIFIHSGAIETIQMKDCCHALEIFFEPNEDITLKFQTYLNVNICMWY